MAKLLRVILLMQTAFAAWYFQLACAHAKSREFTIWVEKIEVLLIDKLTGKLSGNQVGKDRKVLSWKTPSRPADDVFLRVQLRFESDGNITPTVRVLVTSGVWPNNKLVHEETVFDYFFASSGRTALEQGQYAYTAIVRDVTCDLLAVSVTAGSDPDKWRQTEVPFSCVD